MWPPLKTVERITDKNSSEGAVTQTSNTYPTKLTTMIYHFVNDASSFRNKDAFQLTSSLATILLIVGMMLSRKVEINSGQT